MQSSKTVAFCKNVKQVGVKVVGNTWILSPVGSIWGDWFENGLIVSDDFMNERSQGFQKQREILFDDEFDFVGFGNWLTLNAFGVKK